MTVSATTQKVSYSGNGSTVDFDFAFECYASTDLVVTVKVDSTGVSTTQTETTHYTVSLTGTGSPYTGGTITFVTAPASGETVVISRSLPQTQTTDLITGGDFAAETVEQRLDRLTMQVQDLQEETNRCIKTPLADTTSTALDNEVDRAGKYVFFSSTDGALSTTDSVSLSTNTVSTFMEGVIDRTSALAARTALDAAHLAWVDIMNYSAVDDNSTDNATPIADALAALPADGGVILFPPTALGYKVDSTITLPAGKKVVLYGPGAEIIAGMTDGTDLFTVPDDCEVLFGGLELTGIATCGHAIYHLLSATGSKIRITDCYIHGFTRAGKYAVYAERPHKIVIDGFTRIQGNVGGIYIKIASYGASVINSYIQGNTGYNLRCIGTTSHIAGNWFDGCANGVGTQPVVVLEDFRGSFIGNKVDGRGYDQHLLWVGQNAQTAGSQGFLITGNNFEFPSATTPTDYCLVIDTLASDGIIAGNKFSQRNTALSPVRCQNAAAVGNIARIQFGQNTWQTGGGAAVVSYDSATNIRSITASFLKHSTYHFYRDNIAADATVAALAVGGTMTEYNMPINGWVVGASVRSNADFTAGTVVVTIRYDTTAVGDTLTLDDTNQDARYYKPAFVDAIARATDLNVQIVSTGAAPTTCDLSIIVHVAHDIRDYP